MNSRSKGPELILKLLLLTHFFYAGGLQAEEEGGFESGLPADITYTIADLKYNSIDGVKICEIQQGRASRFAGYDFVYEEDGLIAKELVKTLCKYHNRGWFLLNDIRDPYTVQALAESGWRAFETMDQLLEDAEFLEEASKPVYNPLSISHYSGILFARGTSIGSLDAFRAEFPGVLVMDAASFDYYGDKLKSSLIFTEHPVLESFKPKWNLFPKEYSTKLSQLINNEIGSDILVIKPRKAYRGNGVIVVSSENLDATLEYILSGSEELMNDIDPSYSFWASHKGSSFIVEEYISSNPVSMAQYPNDDFDPTMRVVFVFTRHENQNHVHFLGNYWKLPERSINDEGTLNDKHKSCGKIPYFLKVDSETTEKVYEELQRCFYYLYLEMLHEKKVPIDNARSMILGSL